MDKNELLKVASTLVSPEMLKALKSIRKITNYDKLNIYEMDTDFDYDMSHLTPIGVYNTQELMMRIFHEVAPNVKINYTAPNYGCSAFQIKNKNSDGHLFGRNYDFKFDSSAMIIHNHPKNGYRSISTSALNNVMADDPLSSPQAFISCLTAPFICIDGINEKGVGIAVLTLDSGPTIQNTNKPVLATTLLIRLVLDKAASTKEAIELIRNYDVYAISGRDYHFFICDNSGDAKVIEFDCHDKNRSLVVSESKYVTNFYIKYLDKVLPNQKNGVYGHGRERYDKIEKVINKNNGVGDESTSWEALIAASQLPNPDNVTSNTQWSIVYDLSTLSSKFVLHRNWKDIYKIKL